ncbi:MAG: nickel pincer cofactor biosynthesis protein LarB [Pirellulales bacterium]
MDAAKIETLAQQLLSGEMPLEEFVRALARSPVAAMEHASIDLDRHRRCGFPEVVFGQGKSPETLQKIFQALLDDGVEVLCTRVDAENGAVLTQAYPDGRYNALGRIFRVGQSHQTQRLGSVALVTAGTSDLPVAEEARETIDWMGVDVNVIHDIGVAGPHRLLERVEELQSADAVVVVAGMEGALPSVVGGHVACPVIAVPTSVGYGASFGGVAALLGMLNSCAANVAVVNIDAGFKGGYLAAQIARGKHG